MTHNRFPISRCRSAAAEGIECRADSAFLVTERDLRYSAGFQMGRPKGCSMLMACGQFGQPGKGTHILAILDGDALLVPTATILILIVVITAWGLLALVLLVVSVLLHVVIVATGSQGRGRAVRATDIAADTTGPAGDVCNLVACTAGRTSTRN